MVPEDIVVPEVTKNAGVIKKNSPVTLTISDPVYISPGGGVHHDLCDCDHLRRCFLDCAVISFKSLSFECLSFAFLSFAVS